jgi:hypothetical protein
VLEGSKIIVQLLLLVLDRLPERREGLLILRDLMGERGLSLVRKLVVLPPLDAPSRLNAISRPTVMVKRCSRKSLKPSIRWWGA